MWPLQYCSTNLSASCIGARRCDTWGSRFVQQWIHPALVITVHLAAECPLAYPKKAIMPLALGSHFYKPPYASSNSSSESPVVTLSVSSEILLGISDDSI